ncbi:hypothetical protein [Nocardia nova]|uniref:hypothetical protein n=1 Tax=Nocardia nova TaxID=37330 RepID=UPI0034088DEB
MTRSDAPRRWNGGVNAECLSCNATYSLRISRHDKVGNHRCTCGRWLHTGRPGPNLGRYLCPITLEPVTLGQTGIRLDRGYRLEFRPYLAAPGTPHEHLVAEPYRYQQDVLDRLDGVIFGADCVVDRDYDPDLYNHLPETKRTTYLSGALRLAPAAPGPGTTITVNPKLTYGSCAACGTRVLDLSSNRVATDWLPGRWIPVNKRRPTPVGATSAQSERYPADSLACPQCAPPRY